MTWDTAERIKEIRAATGELIPGMREQGKGIKCYVETEYADLKAVLVGNPSVIGCPNGETYEYANMFRHAPDEFKAYIKKYGGTNLWDTDPATAEKMAMESDALAAAYRIAGVRVIRNEVGADAVHPIRPVRMRGLRPLLRVVLGDLEQQYLGDRPSRGHHRDHGE